MQVAIELVEVEPVTTEFSLVVKLLVEPLESKRVAEAVVHTKLVTQFLSTISGDGPSAFFPQQKRQILLSHLLMATAQAAVIQPVKLS